MIKEIMLSAAQELGLNADPQTSSAYGTYNSFGMSIKAIQERNCFLFNTWVRKGALTGASVSDFLAEYQGRPGNGYVSNYQTTEYGVSVILSAQEDPAKLTEQLIAFIEDITSFLSMNYYSNACANCGSSIGVSVSKKENGIINQMCGMCRQKETENAASVPVQPMQSVPPVQPMQSVPPVQPMQSVPPAQPVQSATPEQPVQNVTPIQPTQNSYGVVGVVPTSEAGGSMEAINPSAMPESTGYATAESISKLAPPVQGMQGVQTGYETNYQSAPIANDFRAESVYTQTPSTFTPYNTAAYNPMTVKPMPETSNPLLGAVGAILFGLIGCVVWIIIGMLGRVHWLGGLAIAFSAITGYKLFGKKFDVFGVIICLVTILLAVLGCNIFIYTNSLFQVQDVEVVLEYLGYNGFMDVFFNFFDFASTADEILSAMGETTIMGEFVEDLVISYLISIGAFAVIAVPEYKKSH